MPSSAVYTFTDPDDFAAAIRTSTTEVTVTGRGQFAAKLTAIRLHRLWMHRSSDNLPRIAHTTDAPGRAIVSFLIVAGADLLWSGAELHPTNLIRNVDGGDAFHRSSGSTSYGPCLCQPRRWFRSERRLPDLT